MTLFHFKIYKPIFRMGFYKTRLPYHLMDLTVVILGIMVIFPVRETLTVTRHLGRVLLCLALRFGQFIRYTG